MGESSARKRGGGDMVLESRHLVGLFLGVVVLCGVFFTLGYVMGRTQYDASVSAATAAGKESSPPVSPPKAPEKTAPPVPGPSEWDFYRAAEPKKAVDRLQKPESAVKSKPPEAPQPAPKNAARKTLFKAPVIPRGGVVLQVAALTRVGDALALAEALQQKEFPAFVLTPVAGNLYRVQVGPYNDAKTADAARRALQREGFKAIVRP